MTAGGAPSSLRRRLLLSVLGGTALCWIAIAGFSFVDAHHEIDEMFDAQLAQTAQTLHAIAVHGDDDVAEDRTGIAHKYQRKLRFQIWNDDGELILRSPNAPAAPMASRDGFSDDRQGHRHWRHYSQWDERRKIRVQVGEDHAVRDELVLHIAARLLLPLAIGLPVLALLAWWAIGNSLRPLKTVAGQIGQRHPEHLQPLEPSAAPSEIQPLVDALNILLQRVEQALDNERRFTADAAHELRTPLAALQAQLQVAQRATSDAERNHALRQLAIGIERSTRLVSQLLILARLDPQRSLEDREDIDLAALACEVCAELGPQALAKSQTLELEAATALFVAGNADLLRVLVRNLIDNAIRYTHAGGRIRVSAEVDNGAAELCVSDNGPGVPAAERQQMFRRFHRLAGQNQSGSGLGLSIAQRIVELHRGDIAVGDGLGGQGLSVRVLLRSGTTSRPTRGWEEQPRSRC